MKGGIQMRKWLALAAVVLLVCMMIPSVSYTEDRDTVLLARTIYALGRDESYETKLALGTVVMNRVENAWFADTLGEVLSQAQQFPCGRKYDARSLDAALRLLDGARSLPAEALYAQRLDASSPLAESDLLEKSGGYGFYRKRP